MKTCTKLFGPYPFGHRQATHDGHCKLIHGHNWSFEMEFAAVTEDENGFVIDFGKMGFIKERLADLFDHTLCIANTDPEKQKILNLHYEGLAKVVVLPAVSAEGLAEFVFIEVSILLKKFTNDRVYLRSVTVFEDEKNSARRHEDQ